MAEVERAGPQLPAAEFPGSDQVLLAGLAAADDRAVWAHAASRGLAVVSKDADVAQLSAALVPPPKFIWLRIGNSPTCDVPALLCSRPSDFQTFLADPALAVLELP